MYFKYLFSTTYEGIILFYFSCFKLFQLNNPHVDCLQKIKEYAKSAKESIVFHNLVKVPIVPCPLIELNKVSEGFEHDTEYVAELFNKEMIDEFDLIDLSGTKTQRPNKELLIKHVHKCRKKNSRNLGDIIYGYYLNCSLGIIKKKECMETFKKDIGENCSDYHLLLPSRFTRNGRGKDVKLLIRKLKHVHDFYAKIGDKKILNQIEEDITFLKSLLG